MISAISPDINYLTFNNSILAAEMAVKERVLYTKNEDGSYSEPLRPPEHSYQNDLSYILQYFKSKSDYCNPLRKEQFALSYQAPRKDMYLRACESLDIKPFCHKDAQVKAFLKFEKYNFKPGKLVVPRVISPRGPRFTVSLGRYIKPIEKKIYEIVNDLFGSKTIMKGLNQELRGKVIAKHWNSFLNPVAIGLDASRFDQHVSKEALKFEHSIYQLFYPNSTTLRNLLKYQLVNHCSIVMKDGMLTYKTNGSRMSGDVNTALGNCLISCILVYDYVKSLGIEVKLVNDGDDCVVFMEQEYEGLFRNGLAEYYSYRGFKMVVEPTVYELEHVSFCQSNPVWVPGGYIMTRNPHTSITKDCVSLKPLDNPSVYKMWMASVGLCGMSLAGGLPILQDFYALFVRSSDGAKKLRDPTMDLNLWYKTLGLDRKYQSVHPYTRYSFWLAFGVSPDEQISIEEFYQDYNLQYVDASVMRSVNFPGF